MLILQATARGAEREVSTLEKILLLDYMSSAPL